MPTFRSLGDADVTGKRVLVRVDLNVPMQDGKVADSTRIEEVAPTLAELADKGGKIILLSHFDRPKGRDPKYSLRPVAAELARLVERPVRDAPDVHRTEDAIAADERGRAPVVNALRQKRLRDDRIRFEPGEAGAGWWSQGQPAASAASRSRFLPAFDTR